MPAVIFQNNAISNATEMKIDISPWDCNLSIPSMGSGVCDCTSDAFIGRTGPNVGTYVWQNQNPITIPIGWVCSITRVNHNTCQLTALRIYKDEKDEQDPKQITVSALKS